MSSVATTGIGFTLLVVLGLFGWLVGWSLRRFSGKESDPQAEVFVGVLVMGAVVFTTIASYLIGLEVCRSFHH